MKKLVVAIAVGMVCVGALAQGRVTLANTSRLVYIDDGTTKVAVTTGLSDALGGLVADLYVGATAESLEYSGLRSSSWVASSPGTFSNVTGNLPSPYAGGTGTKWFFQVVVHNPDSSVMGASEIFQAFASSSPISANSIITTGSPSFSTWAVGTEIIDGANAGLFGAIGVPVIVPEPTSFALAGLGAAALLIFRRRN